MATAEGDGDGDGRRWGDRDGWGWDDLERRHRGRGGDRGRGRGGDRDGWRWDDRGRGGDRGRGRGGGRPLTGHATAGKAKSGVPHAAPPSRHPSEGPRAASVVHAESTEPRHTDDAVSNADCAHMTFGSFVSGTLDASLTTKPIDSHGDVATVRDDDSIGQSDGRIHGDESKVTLAPPADEYAPPANEYAPPPANSNVENLDITSVQQSERDNFLDVTSNTEYNLSSTPDYATSGPALQDSASQSYLQENQQFQNISPLSSFMQIQNGLPPAIAPLSELDPAFSPLFTNPRMMPCPISSSMSNATVSTQPQEQYHDVDIDNMKKLVQELQLKNAELQQKLDAALAQLMEENKYINSDPLIDDELRKCHDIFLCPNESKYKKLREFLTDPQSKLTIDVKVHDSEDLQPLLQNEKDLVIYIPKGLRESRKKALKLKRLTTVAKYILLGIIEDIYRLHRHGLSLNGKFTIENFYWTHLKKVKFDTALKLVVCKRGRDEMINDYHQIYRILEMSFHDVDLSIPDDLQRLLNLLKSDDPVKYQDIIRYNMSLMSEIGKKAHFITLYDRLQQQINEDSKKGLEEDKKSEKVLKFISKHFTCHGDGEPWSCMASQNMYIEAIYAVRCKNKGTKVLVEPLDLLIVWQNALTHVLESSIKDGKPLFKDEDLVNMLESSIPGVFNELQRAMAEIGLLELPHLMRAMRM